MSKFETRNSKFANQPRAPAAPIRDFTDLDAWKLARQVRRSVYLLTQRFPSEEKHVLLGQSRRAAISVTANIAEGFGRFSYRENVQFCRQARGSAFELRDHLIAATDAGYVSQAEWAEIDGLIQRMIRVLNGYIRATQRRQAVGKELPISERDGEKGSE